MDHSWRTETVVRKPSQEDGIPRDCTALGFSMPGEGSCWWRAAEVSTTWSSAGWNSTERRRGRPAPILRVCWSPPPPPAGTTLRTRDKWPAHGPHALRRKDTPLPWGVSYWKLGACPGHQTPTEVEQRSTRWARSRDIHSRTRQLRTRLCGFFASVRKCPGPRRVPVCGRVGGGTVDRRTFSTGVCEPVHDSLTYCYSSSNLIY